MLFCSLGINFDFTGFVKLFQAALRLRSMDPPASITVKHTRKIKSYSQAFNFQNKAEKSLGSTTIAVKFDVNRKRCSEEKRLALSECFTRASLKGMQSTMIDFR